MLRPSPARQVGALCILHGSRAPPRVGKAALLGAWLVPGCSSRVPGWRGTSGPRRRSESWGERCCLQSALRTYTMVGPRPLIQSQGEGQRDNAVPHCFVSEEATRMDNAHHQSRADVTSMACSSHVWLYYDSWPRHGCN